MLNKYLSLVIPVRDEKDNLPILLSTIKESLTGFKKNYEIIIVDDGSSDQSGLTAENELKKNQLSGKVIYLLSTYGKGAALDAGFKKATGEIIATLDADLQDDPKDILKFIDKINEGYDAVVGWRKERKDKFMNVLSSKIFNFFVILSTGLKIHDINCGLKVFKKEALSNIKVYKGLYRFLPTFIAWKKYKVTEIIVNHHPRRFGKSKYTFFKFIDGIFDLFLVTFLIRFALNPLRIYGVFGFFFLILGGIMAIYLSVLRIIGETIGDRPLLIFSAIFIIGGIQLISLGFLGELIRMNNQEKIFYLVKKEINIE